jgi:hypothetical protein
MKKTLFILFTSFILINGCYTILRHPEIEVYYENENGKDSFAEQFDVVVNEDCKSCHGNFQPTQHFTPLSPMHQNDWSRIPWWFDDNYMTIFGSSSPSISEDDNDTDESLKDNAAQTTSPPAYIRSPRTSDSTTSTRISKSADSDSTQDVMLRNMNERKQSDSNRRKFRKRQ